MSFIFKRKPKKDMSQKLEKQQYLAKFEPTNIVDYSECELDDIPNGTYAICNVWLKEVLIVHSNHLKCLKEREDPNYHDFAKLLNLRLLDAHNNEINEIPIEISFLINLQVLNLENNKLRSIPSAMCSLKNLQTLNLKKNQIKQLPHCVGDLKSLRTLDISQNFVTNLPKSLCEAQCLETLIIDNLQMEYPGKNVCEQGTVAIMKFLCEENGTAYTPAANSVLQLMKKPQDANSQRLSPNLSRSCDHIDTMWITNYEQLKQQKQTEALQLQKELLAEQERQAQLIAKTNLDRTDLLTYIAKENADLDAKLTCFTEKRETERKKMLEVFRRTEEVSKNLIEQLMDINRESRKREDLLEANERLRLQEEGVFKIKIEEYENLKKQEVRRAMETQMMQSFSLEQLQRMHDKTRSQVLQEIMMIEAVDAASLNSLLQHKDAQMKAVLQHLALDENFQKKALLALMEQRDAKVNRINSQLEIIQRELAQISLLEMQTRDVRDQAIQIRLHEQRAALSKLLMTLMAEKDKRTEELKKRMIEMEQQRLLEQTDYWLAQYQRLLESKPEPLEQMEKKMDEDVVRLLCMSGAQAYIPAFARRKISMKLLVKLTENDLQALGIYDVTLRKKVLKAIENSRSRLKLGASSSVPLTPTSPTAEIVQARFEVECVVCMEVSCAIVFLPCGHVCCCENCSRTLEQCPLCRSEIIQKVNLHPVDPSAPPSAFLGIDKMT